MVNSSMKNISISLVTILLLSSCLESAPQENLNSSLTEETADCSYEISDSDEIQIGQQVWHSKNLNKDCFNDGIPLKYAKTEDEWKEYCLNSIPAYCYYEFNSDNANFGKLYNKFVIVSQKEIAPENWKIPSHEDWLEMQNFISEYGAITIRSKSYWDTYDKEADQFGFCAYPSGRVMYSGGRNSVPVTIDFVSLGEEASWWSYDSTLNKLGAWFISGQLFHYYSYPEGFDRYIAYSIRLIKVKN